MKNIDELIQKYNVPRRAYKCKNDSKWSSLLKTLSIGDTFNISMNKRSAIYKLAKRKGFKVIGRQLGRDDIITFWFLGKK